MTGSNENYPLNLLDEIAGGQWEHELPNDIDGSLEYVLAELPERERRIIHARFRDNKTLEELSASEKLSREQIRQITQKVILKLAHPTRKRYLIYGVKLMEFRAAQRAVSDRLETAVRIICELSETVKSNVSDLSKTAVEICENVMSKTQIEEIGLSVRSFNCLKRAGLETLGDVCSLSLDGLSGLRNLGKSSFKEVVNIVHGYGMKFKDE